MQLSFPGIHWHPRWRCTNNFETTFSPFTNINECMMMKRWNSKWINPTIWINKTWLFLIKWSCKVLFFYSLGVVSTRRTKPTSDTNKYNTSYIEIGKENLWKKTCTTLTQYNTNTHPPGSRYKVTSL